jgi:prepilin-type N-terminal cleavage/methylation domain-containing protein
VKREAFSLIELLIVVLIVGVVYTLAISNFENVKEGRTKPTLLNLKQKLDAMDSSNQAKLICLDDCKNCTLWIDGKKDANASKEFEDFLDEQVKMYRYDTNFGLMSLQEKVFFNEEGQDEQICFSLSVDKNGVSEQVIVEYKDRFYDFTPYFKPPQVYMSSSELTQIKEHLTQEVLR